MRLAGTSGLWRDARRRIRRLGIQALVDQRPELSRFLAVGTFGVPYAPEVSAPIEKLCRRDEPELFLSGRTLEGRVFACCHLPGLDLVGDEFAQFWVRLHAS